MAKVKKNTLAQSLIASVKTYKETLAEAEVVWIDDGLDADVSKAMEKTIRVYMAEALKVNVLNLLRDAMGLPPEKS